jgi:hypothetical protein
MEELWPNLCRYAKGRTDRGASLTQTPPFGRRVIEGIG